MNSIMEKANERFVLIPQYFGSVIYDHATHQYNPYDAATTGLMLAARRISCNLRITIVAEPGRHNRGKRKELIWMSHDR